MATDRLARLLADLEAQGIDAARPRVLRGAPCTRRCDHPGCDVRRVIRALADAAERTIVHVGLDPSNAASVWVELDPQARKIPVAFMVYGTGFDFPDDGSEHVASWVDGTFVWHLYRQEAPDGD